MTSQLPDLGRHKKLPEPLLSFHPDRESDTHVHPLQGIARFGPYSSGRLPGPIRVATLAPHGESNIIFNFLKELKQEHTPRERREYLPKYPGFKSAFHTDFVAADKDRCLLELEKSVEQKVAEGDMPHVALADALIGAITRLRAARSEFDVLFVYLPQRWAPGFNGPDGFNLHDYMKAWAAPSDVPIQIIRQDKAVSYSCRASVMWRISIALYAKAGGIPWKLVSPDDDVAHIGLSYAMRSIEGEKPDFVTCCSQAFDAEGGGLEFIAYRSKEYTYRNRNPFLSRNEMFKVMTRSMDSYRRRRSGRAPRRVFVHKQTEFKPNEIDGCMEALHLCEQVDLVQIVESSGWRAAKIEMPRNFGGEKRKGVPSKYPIDRGSLLPIGDYEALLWTHGDVEGIADGKSYFQGKRSTPRPLKLIRHAGHGSWDESASAILALTKMNWNTDSLYKPLPVTLEYASVLANVIKRMNNFGETPYQFRFFM